jgi:hypothetical protein
MRPLGNSIALVGLVLLPLAPAWAAEKSVPVQFSDRLFAGSATGAGLDDTAPAEVIRPTIANASEVTIRKLGGVFESGKGSVAVQLIPYFFSSSKVMTYTGAVKERQEFWRTRLVQDTAVTLVAMGGLPFAADEATASRFSTFGVGITTELLGNRSIYSALYGSCVKDKVDQAIANFQATYIGNQLQRPQLGPLTMAFPTRNRGESEAAHTLELANYLAEVEKNRQDYEKRLAEYERDKATAEKQVADLDALVKKTLTECTQTSIASTSALFASVGARWVLPGLQRQEGDAYFIQREYLALTGEYRLAESLSLAVQGRLLGDRTSTAPFQYVSDVGASLTYGGRDVRWSLEAVQVALKPEDRPRSATFTGALKVRAAGEFFISVGVRGEGRDVGDAFGRSALALGLSYEEQPLITRNYSAVP